MRHDEPEPERHPDWPEWADPPYPELAPTRFDLFVLRMTDRLRRYNQRHEKDGET